jgi:hypothetical protein
VYAAEFDKWVHNHPGLWSPQSDIYLIFRNAYEKVANKKISKESFNDTGLHPFNPDGFPDEDILPSEVMNRHQENLKEDPPSETSKELQNACVCREESAEGRHLQITCRIFRIRVQCTEGGRNKNLSIEHVSPAESKSNHQEGSSDGRSEIITFSPFKNSLLKVTKKRRAKDPTRPKGKPFDGPDVGRPSCSRKKKKKKEKENIFCAQCDEQYEGTIAEEWIKCMKCQKWYYEQCCSFDGDLIFNCNIC